MNKTLIPWVKNPDGSQGYTWNPITGCLNCTPEGLCRGGMFPCYAYKLAHGRLRSRYLSGGIFPLSISLHERYPNCTMDPFYPRFWEKRLSAPTPFQKPRGIFVCDMGELFGDWLPERWQEWVFCKIRECRQHRFYLLTKQPQNLIKFSPFPPNCWVGVTVTKPEFLLPALDGLDSIQCSVRYLSIEPMLAAFDVPDLSLLLGGSVDWLILGSQTKPYWPPKMKWIDEVVATCDKAGIPVFEKNNLMPLVEQVFGRENYLSPILTPDGDLRQEMPTTNV